MKMINPISTITKNRQRLTVLVAMLGSFALVVLIADKLSASAGATTAKTSDEEQMMVRQGDKISVPAKSPLRSRLAVLPVATSAPSHIITVPATVEADPSLTVNILPPLTGRLVELKVKLGDVVKQGQVLALISSPDLAQAYADVDKAQDGLELSHKALERARGVNAAGGNAAKDFEQATSNYVQAQAEARRAETRLKVLNGSTNTPQSNAGNTSITSITSNTSNTGNATAINTHTKASSRLLSITAPISGVVTTLTVGSGAYLNDATASLMTVANLNQIWVTANVPEQLVSSVAKGQSADINLPAYPNQTFHGTVAFVSAVLEPDTRRNKVRISFANQDGKLKPNMFATASILLTQTAQTMQTTKTGSAPRVQASEPTSITPITIPTSALLMNNDDITVFVEVAPWTFVRRTVELGHEDNDKVTILSGLTATDRVVVRGGVLLND
ncbi:cobalt-zinc-cadmium efflux system membrane fusion protein [Undibacterium sp. GrIS 1.8]|uniref:efflux RND transporter periplasmic adaptor subunit n=1 Tax=unclassified Undibacterium TaxID=2630295 RepID=UPI003391331E